MQKGYFHFVREIYTYCDSNVGEKALFPVFANLWNENGEAGDIIPRDLAVLTSKIITKLLEKGVLIKISKENIFETPYGLYKILKHDNLIRQDDLAQKRTKLFK